MSGNVPCEFFYSLGYETSAQIFPLTSFDTCELPCLEGQLSTVVTHFTKYENIPGIESYFPCVYTDETITALEAALNPRIEGYKNFEDSDRSSHNSILIIGEILDKISTERGISQVVFEHVESVLKYLRINPGISYTNIGDFFKRVKHSKFYCNTAFSVVQKFQSKNIESDSLKAIDLSLKTMCSGPVRKSQKLFGIHDLVMSIFYAGNGDPSHPKFSIPEIDIYDQPKFLKGLELISNKNFEPIFHIQDGVSYPTIDKVLHNIETSRSFRESLVSKSIELSPVTILPFLYWLENTKVQVLIRSVTLDSVLFVSTQQSELIRRKLIIHKLKLKGSPDYISNHPLLDITKEVFMSYGQEFRDFRTNFGNLFPEIDFHLKFSDRHNSYLSYAKAKKTAVTGKFPKIHLEFQNFSDDLDPNRISFLHAVDSIEQCNINTKQPIDLELLKKCVKVSQFDFTVDYAQFITEIKLGDPLITSLTRFPNLKSVIAGEFKSSSLIPPIEHLTISSRPILNLEIIQGIQQSLKSLSLICYHCNAETVHGYESLEILKITSEVITRLTKLPDVITGNISYFLADGILLDKAVNFDLPTIHIKLRQTNILKFLEFSKLCHKVTFEICNETDIEELKEFLIRQNRIKSVDILISKGPEYLYNKLLIRQKLAEVKIEGYQVIYQSEDCLGLKNKLFRR
jgi:hypothetical protein